MTNNMMI